MENQNIINKLKQEKKLEFSEWCQLLGSYTKADMDYAAKMAREIATEHFGKKVYFRGIIEFTNYCKRDCFYCGIRCSNKNVSRYRLTNEEIMECCKEGYELGYRTYVLQGGEDPYWTDERMIAVIREIKDKYPDCAITLSLGERQRESYEALYNAGADRYLLRHETSNEEHYSVLHPSSLVWKERMECLKNLKEIGYQTGCGIMVGTPEQTVENLAEDMIFMGNFKPHMIGIGPFIPHKDTPFRDKKAGNSEMTLFILSLCRIMLPTVLLPATTALGTLQGDGRQLGVLAGCNVVMPNLSPTAVREKYMLYDNKVGTSDDAQEGIKKLKVQMEEIGYSVYIGRGDFKEYISKNNN